MFAAGTVPGMAALGIGRCAMYSESCAALRLPCPVEVGLGGA